MLVAQEVVDHLEPLLSFRIVRAADILAALELALRMVPEEGKNGNDARWADVEREFVLINGELLDEARQALKKE